MGMPAPVFDPSAVVEGRPPGRARVGVIAGIILAAFCVIVVFGIELAEAKASGHSAAPFFIALPLALAPVPLLIAVALFVDRLEPEPRINLVFGFLWGAGIAALFAALINTAGLEYITQPALGASAGEYVSATVGAPIVEETLKGLFLVWLVRWRRQELDGPTDGIVYAAMVGIGFAMTENIGYYINAEINPIHGGAQLLGYTFVLRGVLSPFLHPTFTSMTGIGAAYAASHRNSNWALPLGWLAAMCLHAMWNGLSIFGLIGTLFAYVFLLCLLIVLYVVIRRDRTRIVGLIRNYLPGYEGTGLVTGHDIEMLSSLRDRRQARKWARASGGLSAASAMGDYQLAATELALLHQKAHRGVISRRQFAQGQQGLLSLMQSARGQFQRRQPSPPPTPWTGSQTSAFTQPMAYQAPMPRPPEASGGRPGGGHARA
jgi:RsiW-degrading membrane proteinase PrsW (M82 family)